MFITKKIFQNLRMKTYIKKKKLKKSKIEKKMKSFKNSFIFKNDQKYLSCSNPSSVEIL